MSLTIFEKLSISGEPNEFISSKKKYARVGTDTDESH